MHDPIEISPGVSWVGVNDRETGLFESMWPLPRGISYNAYLIVGEKIALVDAVKKLQIDGFIAAVRKALPPGRSIDYLIINHIEPDHSGAIEVLSSLYPGMKIAGNKRTFDLMEGFYGMTENLHAVQDGDELDLGGRKLSFHITPMVHWPETMMTYDKTAGILFSGDAFGSFGTLDGGLFDDEIDPDVYEGEMLRYYSNIIGRFSAMVHKAIRKVEPLDIRMVASTHGPVWRKDPGYPISRYDRWSRFEPEPGAVLAYASMYGSTLRMAEAVARGLALGGLKDIMMHDVSKVHASFIIRDIWRYGGVVLGSCTYELGLFPLMRNLVELLEEKALKNRRLGLFGTYGWSGGAVKRLKEFAGTVSWDLVDPVLEVKCSARDAQLDECMQLGRNMAAAVKP
jgi:flavorubredoxin